MNKKAIITIFKLKNKGANKNENDQPPQKSITKKAAISKIFAYSAKKKAAKIMPEYSTL